MAYGKLLQDGVSEYARCLCKYLPQDGVWSLCRPIKIYAKTFLGIRKVSLWIFITRWRSILRRGRHISTKRCLGYIRYLCKYLLPDGVPESMMCFYKYLRQEVSNLARKCCECFAKWFLTMHGGITNIYKRGASGSPQGVHINIYYQMVSWFLYNISTKKCLRIHRVSLCNILQRGV